MALNFPQLVSALGRDAIDEILFNWNESELNEEGSEILVYVDGRAYGPRTGGADIVDKAEFFEWLLSEAPFDPRVYGQEIANDLDWRSLIDRARACATNNE